MIFKNRRSQTESVEITSTPKIFWCGQYIGQEGCCFNHFIGLPEKDGIPHPIYAYEEHLLEDVEKYDYLAIVKATGLGITEFFLRYAEWKSLTDYNDAHVVIVVGPNINLAKMQIERIKKHLYGKVNFEHDAYRIKIGTNIIESFPSMNIDAIRSLKNPKLILVDEAAFFGMKDDSEVRAIAERYEAKSGAKVVMFSTPGGPSGMFYDLVKEEPSQYKKIYLPYTEGLHPHKCNLSLTIYKPESIEEAKKSISFGREYDLQWGYGTGNIFNLQSLESSKENYQLESLDGYETVLSLDPAYGSSKFGVVLMQKRGNMQYVLVAEQYERPDVIDMFRRIDSLLIKYRPSCMVVDSARPEIKTHYSENQNTRDINFRELGQDMTDHAAIQVNDGKVKINPVFEELIRQLRSVKKNEKGTPDKTQLTYDLGDCFHMALWYFKQGEGSLIKI